ncbi:hypothetical protein EGT62_15805 [Acinetobacter junii]|nr:hypothetical protein EGT62_15805 [Acinetobacter junii]
MGRLGKKGTTALNFQENYNAFRITCIMLILGNLQIKTRGANESITRNYLFSIYGKPKIMVDSHLWHRVIIAN